MLASLFKGIDSIDTHTQTIHTHTDKHIPVVASVNSTAMVSSLILKFESGRTESEVSQQCLLCVSESRNQAGQMVHACVCVKEKVKLARPVWFSPQTILLPLFLSYPIRNSFPHQEVCAICPLSHLITKGKANLLLENIVMPPFVCDLQALFY